jgi:ribose transport system substrate-binding protein
MTLAVLLAGCDGGSTPKPGPKAGSDNAGKSASGKAAAVDKSGAKKFRIAVIPKGHTHQFWKSVHAGAIKAQRELGNVEIEWKGPDREDNREGQIAVVENFVNGGIDAIVLAPLDRTALVGPVRMAKQRKIPVVIIDSALDAPDLIASYVATDNTAGGRLAGSHMGKLMGGKGNVVVLRYQPNSASTEQREAGFLEALKKEHPGIKVISEDQFSGATREEAMTRAEALVARLGDQVGGWFCPCEPVTYGTLRVFQQRGLLGKVKLIGFDTSAEMVDAVRKDHVHALILQDPINMGYLGVKTAVRALQGEKVEPVISTGENLITKENLDQPRSKELHSPDLKTWLGE